MKKTNPIQSIGLIALILAITIASAFSQQPPPLMPRNLTATFVEKSIENIVTLAWQRDTAGTMPQFFNIYLAPFNTDSTRDCKLFVTVKNFPDRIDYTFDVLHLMDGTYSFFITSAIDDHGHFIESPPTPIVKVDVFQKPFFRLVPPPNSMPIFIQEGIEFDFLVKYESNKKCNVTFEFNSEVPQGMVISDSGLIRWTPQDTGLFTVKVKGTMNCDTVMVSEQQYTFRVGPKENRDYINITSKPNPNIKIGETWTYTITAKSNKDCAILFDTLGKLPPGMIFDKDKGVLTWAPTQAGNYGFGVKAYLDCQNDLQAIQQIMLCVNGGNEQHGCATIYGNVNYDDNTVVKDGLIKIICVDSSNHNPPYVIMINDGKYFARVNEGNYIIQASGKDFQMEWYENVKDMKDAKIIPLKCNDSLDIDLTVTANPVPKTFKVTGKVTSADDGTPIGAMVEFIPIDWMNSSTNDKHGFATRTDKDGNYSIELTDQFTYIAHAINAMNSVQYLEQFYDKVDNPMEADLIVLTADRDGIDFLLKKFQITNLGFSGNVINSDNAGIRSHLVACLVKTTDSNQQQAMHFTQNSETDSLGAFKFNNLIPGEYVVLSNPFDRFYVPGYYKENDFVTLKWREATHITVTSTLDNTIYLVKHQNRKELLGSAKLNGHIYDNSGALSKIADNPLAKNPVAGAYIYAKDETGNVVDYTFTDSQGYFELTDLGQGTYKIGADKVGYFTIESDLETNYQDKANQSLDLDLSQIPSSVTDYNAVVVSVSVYPLPATDNINLSFNATAGFAQLSIFNSLGELISVNPIATIDGANLATISTSNLTSGVYYMRIQTNSGINTVPISIIR